MTPGTPDRNFDPDVRWNAIVVGGGIVGLSTALELLSRGNKVVLIDRDVPRARASFGNNGVISRGSLLTVASPGFWNKVVRYAANRHTALRIRYSSLPSLLRWIVHFSGCCNEATWRRCASALNPLTGAAYEHHLRLADLVGARSLIKRNGYLRLFRAPATFAATRLEREILAEAGVEAAILNANELRELEPALKRSFASALFFPGTGCVEDPAQLVELYREAFLDRGGAFVTGNVEALEPGSHNVTARLAGRKITAAHAVIAAGAWSDRLTAPLGYRFPYAAERGYHAYFSLQGEATINRPMVDVDGSYGAAPVGGRIRITCGIELADADDPADYSQLEAAIATARPVLPIERMIEDSRWMGSRPSVADGLPVIGRAPRHPRLLLAFGHGHIGLSTGPVTGRIVADLLGGLQPPIPIQPFAIERFGR